MSRLSRAEKELMVRRATRLAALQILYGQQFKGETLYQTDPYLSEAEEGGEGDAGLARSDRVFLAKLLSCARTHRRILQGWLSGRIAGRSWENVDLLLRLIMWLGISEMLLVSMEEAGKGFAGGEGRGGSRAGLGRIAGEYCGMTSLFYDDAGVIGFVNGVLDGASRSDLGEVVRGDIKQEVIKEEEVIKKEDVPKVRGLLRSSSWDEV